MSKLTLQFFLARTVTEGRCRIWTGASVDGKYPKIEVKGKTLNVRREVYKLAGGELPDRLQIGARCGCPLCIEPKCLVARSRRTAMKHAVFTAGGKAAKAAAVRRRAVITMEAARAIRVSNDTNDVLGARYGIAVQQVRRIRSGRAWPEPNPFAGLGARPAWEVR